MQRLGKQPRGALPVLSSEVARNLLVPEGNVRLSVVDDRAENSVAHEILVEILHARDARREIDDTLFLVLCDVGSAFGWQAGARNEHASSLSVLTTSSIALPRIVGRRTPIVACAKEYSWYPRYAGHGGLLGSTREGVRGYCGMASQFELASGSSQQVPASS